MFSASQTALALESQKHALPPFLLKLQQITTSVPPALASWSQDGRSFVVHSKDFEKFLKDFFKGNLQTFIRQLHFYGFHKMDTQDGKWSFAHVSFRRDFPHLLYEIKRKTRSDAVEVGATTTEVQALRTQVVFLQGVIEELTVQLDCVLSVVESEGLSPAEVKERRLRKARAGSKRTRIDSIPDPFDSKCESVARNTNSPAFNSLSPASSQPTRGEGALSSKPANFVVRPTPALANSSSSRPSFPHAKTKTSPHVPNRIPLKPIVPPFQRRAPAAPQQPIRPMVKLENSAATSTTMKSSRLSTLSTSRDREESEGSSGSGSDRDEAGSLGSVTEEDWANVMSMDLDEPISDAWKVLGDKEKKDESTKKQKSTTEKGPNGEISSSSTSSPSLTAPGKPSAPVGAGKKQTKESGGTSLGNGIRGNEPLTAQPTENESKDDAASMVASATQLDGETVSKVLSYLRKACVNLATKRVEREKGQQGKDKDDASSLNRLPSLPSPRSSGGGIQRQLSGSCGVEASQSQRMMQGGGDMGRDMNMNQIGNISQADQYAVLLPLLLHIPQVQSALLEYKKFGKGALTPSLKA